ncbi:MAG: hypothetical protein JZU64_01855 [Rhodoferax sp.]|jgi:hypothetical protein|nr:hypothetical protein [Rhodoferax sp.]
MAELGEWTNKGASLSDATAQKEYGISREFVVQGIRAGKLEYRNASMYGNPVLRILRSQVEKYIDEQLGAGYLQAEKTKTELRKIKTEINSLKRRLTQLEARKAEIEKSIIKT